VINPEPKDQRGDKMRTIFSEHALFEIDLRRIKKENVEHFIEHPMQIIPAKKNRTIIQGRYYDDIESREMLLRIVGEKSEKCLSCHNSL